MSISHINKSTSARGLSQQSWDRIHDLLRKKTVDGYERGLFSEDDLKIIKAKLDELAQWLKDNPPSFLKDTETFQEENRFDEKTVMCISYIDHIETGLVENSAKALVEFFNKHLAGLYSHLHILPHFPSPIIDAQVRGPASRADGGFEAMNFKMDTKFGSEADLKQANASLMLDFVINHLSSKGDIFDAFLKNKKGYENFFLSIPGDKIDELDLGLVFRPREHYPLIEHKKESGNSVYVWSTFSETQADVNIKDISAFCFLLEALVKDFIGHEAVWIRLDAVGYLVKMLGLEENEPKTDCFGIEETHNVLKAIRTYLEEIAPQVTLVPEVNARGDVIATYYGEGDEGHMAYEFPSAPLSIFSIYTEDARAAINWAKGRTQHPERIGLAFSNSHDGIGVLPMSDVEDMPDGDLALDFLLSELERRGGGINYKSKLIDGETKRVPYEVCITWLQAILSPPEKAAMSGNRLNDDQVVLIIRRFIASQSFIYTAPHCVPADYMGVITAQLNDEVLYERAGHRRNKNRGLIDPETVELGHG